MPRLVAHPTDEELAAFALGKAPAPEGSWVEEHVARCDDCQRRAAAVGPDSLLTLLSTARSRLGVDQATVLTPDPSAGSTPSMFAPTRGWNADTTSAGEEVPGALFGHPKYRVVRRLGAGGMGTVWLAEHTVMSRPVAVKLIRPELLARPGAADRFLREVRAAAKLSHENIVRAYDAEAVGGSCLLVMEYVDGRTLADRVAEGPLPVAEACRAVRDAARGLAHAHAAGLVHRDVKPHNLIRAADGTVKVLDFGLAGVAAGEETAPAGDGLTGAGMVAGTPDYIAPEQIADPHAADARADVYGLGCTLYHLLAGHPPFAGQSVAEKLAAQESHAPAPIPELAADLAATLAKMMAKRPEDRYQTATEVAAALESVLAKVHGEKRQAESKRPRRRLAVAAGLSFLALAVAAGVVFKIQRDNQEITIETDDPDVEVVMKRKGEVVRVIDHKSGQTWEIDTATNQIGLADAPGGLTLTLPEGAGVVMRRKGEKDGKPVFAIARTSKPVPEVAEKVGEVRRFEGHEASWVSRAVFTPDGRLAISAGDCVRVWDVAGGKQVGKLAVPGDWTLAVSPDGTRVLCSSGIVVRLFDLAAEREVLTLKGHTGVIWGTVFLPDGKQAISASQDRTVRVWDLENGEEVRQFEGVAEGVRCLALSPNGRRLATGHFVNPDAGVGILRVWDVETGKEVRDPIRVPHVIFAVAFSRDGSSVLTGDLGGTVRLWNVTTGEEMRRFEGHTAPVEGVAFTPDGRVLSTGGRGDGALRIWDPTTGKQLESFQGPAVGLLGLAVGPDGRHALTGGKDAIVRLWRLPAPPPGEKFCEVRRFDDEKDGVWSVAFSPDGRRVLKGGGTHVVLYDRESGTNLLSIRHGCWSAYLSPDARQILTATAGGTLHLWDTTTGLQTQVIAPQRGRARNAVFSPNGKLIASSHADGFVHVWDTATGREVQKVPAFDDSVRSAAFTPDGSQILVIRAAVVGNKIQPDNTLCLFDVKTGEEVRSFEGHTGPIYDVTLSEDGRRALSASVDGTVRLWDVAGGKELHRLEGHTGAVRAVAFCPGGRRAVSGGSDRFVRLWDLETGKEIHSFEGHTGDLVSVDVSRDGRYAVSGGMDRTVRLWRLSDAAAVPKP